MLGATRLYVPRSFFLLCNKKCNALLRSSIFRPNIAYHKRGTNPITQKTQKMEIQIQLKNGQDYTDLYNGAGTLEDWVILSNKLERESYDPNAHGLYVVSIEWKDVNNCPAHFTFYTWADPMPHV